MTARAISSHDRGCSAPLNPARTSRSSSCRPNQSQPLRLGLRGRISSGSASGHMMRIAASRCTRSARSWSSVASSASISPASSARLRIRGRIWRSWTRTPSESHVAASGESYGLSSRSNNRQRAAEDQGCGSPHCLASRISPAQRRAGGTRSSDDPTARSGNPACQPGGSREDNLGAQKARVYLAEGEFAPFPNALAFPPKLRSPRQWGGRFLERPLIVGGMAN